MTTTEAALRDALQNPQLDAALLRILQGGQGLGDAEKFAFRALRDCIATLATVGQDGGPFHVSRSSDGEKEWFSARDAAAGVSIPAKCRDDAYALVASLNRSCVTYAALSQPSPASSTAGEAREIVERMAYGYELMFRAICNIVGTSGERESWYRTEANKILARVDPLHSLSADSNPHKPGDCLTQYKRFAAPSSGEPASVAEKQAREVMNPKSGSAIAPSGGQSYGASSFTFGHGATAGIAPTPVEAGLREALRKIADHEAQEWDDDLQCYVSVASDPDALQAIALAALSETQPPRETSTETKESGE